MFNNVNKYHGIYRVFWETLNNIPPAHINHNILSFVFLTHNFLQTRNIFCIWLAAYLDLSMNIGLWNDTASYIQ